MMPIPELTRVDVAFGNISHMPKYETLPDAFRDWNRNPFCEAVSSWFCRGAKAHKDGIEIRGVAYVAKPGVSASKALAAIKAVLGSFEPKHEHKIAACGFMLSEWFDKQPSK